MAVPFLDLRVQFAEIQDEIWTVIRDVVESQQFILGPAVERFEGAITETLGVRHAIGLASGTDALFLSLRALDLGPGDEVVTTPFTFFATAGAIHNAGARPVFVDIEPDTLHLDAARVEDVLTPRTRAVLPVHLFGQMADLDPLLELCERHGLVLVEDAAQAMGSRGLVRGAWRMAGTVGRVGCFSFFPTKNLGGYGDGGLVVTDDDGLAARLRRLRVHGGARTYFHEEVGVNSRLDALQAAVLLAKLPYLAGWNEERRANAAWYDRRLAGLAQVKTPVAQPDRLHTYHQYTIRAQRRDELKRFLDARGIGNAVYYPLPLHLQPCFQGLGYRPGRFPEAERASAEVLSLPIYPGLTQAQREEVAGALEAFYR
ncbi:MAG: DegT/DnrJ/EryC1/StrS family aminotransferase [Gemmatimonadetes bacterium]|nr:DegT/DnrJ/EryC1/StrS family aminotransferase [Gemmatimonadota bacterium]